MAAIIKIDIDPVFVRIGGLSIHWYGIMYVVGIGVALLVVLRYVEARGLPRDQALEIFFPIVIAGLIGGRLYYVVQSNFGYYLQNPVKILATWEGGMAFFGAIIGASLMIAYMAARRNISVWMLLDAGAIFAPLGQSFGRVGNIINGDIVGYRSTCGWCTAYTNPHSFAQQGVSYQPAAAYELLISLAIFAIVYSLRFRMPLSGMLFALYLMLYSMSQFGIFFLRDEPVTAFGLKQAQLSAVVTFAVGAALYTYLWWRRPRDRTNVIEGRSRESQPAGSTT